MRPTGTKAVPVAAQKARTMRALRERPCQWQRRRRARCAPYGKGRANPSAEGAHDARPTGKAVPASAQKARTMRALRERRPCQPQRRRRARCALRERRPCLRPRRRRARCAPYGNEGRASGSAEGAHDARPTGTKAVPASAQKARTMRALRERRPCLPQRRRRARYAPYGNEGRACLSAEGAHDARPTGTKAVPASAQKARTMRTIREQRPCLPQRRRRARCAPYGNEGRASGSAEGAHDARPTGTKALPTSAQKARTMRALRERPCRRQCQTHMPRGAQ